MKDRASRRGTEPSHRLISDDMDYVGSQYRTQDNLAVRIRTHELYSENSIDFAAWILEPLPWHGNEIVVDVGCGAGFYIGPVSRYTQGYIAGDLSLGMLRGLKSRGVSRLNLDAQHLPLRGGTVDVILANHMLYHVPDIGLALREFRRVLRPEGRLVAATNSAGNMAELAALQAEAMALLHLPAPEQLRLNLTFTLENGAQLLRRHFAHVERRDLHGALVFAEAQPVIDYVATTYERIEHLVPQQVSWEDVSQALRSILQQKIARYGEFRVQKLSGVFICWNDEA